MIDKQAFYDAIGEWAGIQGTVTYVEETAEEEGGCPSCYGGYRIEVEIGYLNPHGKKCTTYKYGSLADFINSLE